MEFKRIRDEVKSLSPETLRSDNSDYFEAVFIKGELVKLNARLTNFFGEPAWPSKDKLTSQMDEAIKDFGGIQGGQTLYFKGVGINSLFAMLWPWQDGVHTTIKIAYK
ncbi:MAG: hypothetical protein NTW18_00140 [Candidatus Omnitrophica bacterium]|nr:hypothetical protein [Candidatus Omnitrophota bacterium]